MSTRTIALLFGLMPLLINGDGRWGMIDCLENHWPGVKPVNSTHIKVGWSKGDGSGFENCDDSEQHIYFENYKIILDGKSLGLERHTRKEYSAVIKADPCLKHDVVVKLKVHNEELGDEVWKTTKIAHYNNETGSLFSNLLKEGIKRMCNVDDTIQLKPLPDVVREKCIKRILNDKETGSVFLKIINPNGKHQDETVCVRGKSDKQELQQCNVDFPITIEVSRKREVDQTLEIVSNEYCFGDDKADNLPKKTSVGFGTIGWYIFIGMLCFVGAMTLVGVVIMIRNNCHFKVQCCIICKEEEKTDLNLDYGTYYYDDGGRRTDVVEARDHNPDYDDYDYTESDLHNVITDNNPQYYT